MTDDRELLELAAKAAGIQYTISENGAFLIAPYTNPLAKVSWNPLTDDGDAFRLAVKLRMSVKNTEIRASVIVEHGWVVTTEPHNNDPLAATRRAIVRAAAEIGKGTE